MENKKVELLAPAGNYESFLGAIHAGADAVYLGGEKFGARAYADNFSGEEICQAISYAHIFGRKVYLTVNTLIKDSEFDELVPYLEPFYLAGLDGVIVQDIGAFLTIREAFPGLELHVSTQMTVTGSYGAKLLKKMGAVRIVPARELSLEEIKAIKDETGLEMETFIHGAMCYCYSGQCLFSSILGGRSGNRGRCAQPCRLPYQIVTDGKPGKEQYPLSLKDMCTISFLPKLIEAGIDSFKIEGRMKKPEYAAGVTAIYRKYIDLYYQNGASGYKVSREDMQELSSLYIRSQIQEGYYFKHNGADMVTLSSPAYSGSDEQLLAAVRKKYIADPLKKRICMDAEFKIGEAAKLTIWVRKQEADTKTVSNVWKDTEGPLTVTVSGEMVMPAEKQPVSEENMIKGLQKLGATPFYAESSDIRVTMEKGIFYPLKAINELRRKGIEALTKAFCPYERSTLGREAVFSDSVFSQTEIAFPTKSVSRKKKALRVLVSTPMQLEAVLKTDADLERIYLESEMLALSPDIWHKCQQDIRKAFPTAEIWIALPYILRQKDIKDLSALLPLLNEADGCLIRNMEAYECLKEQDYTGKILTDAGVYCFNQKTLAFWMDNTDGCCLPYELNKKEKRQLLKSMNSEMAEQVIYGYIPMMVTANCISRTAGKCLHGDFSQNILHLKDRYKKQFPVSIHCRYCYNIIYNTLPLSLHDMVLEGNTETAMRLCFTIETGQETENVMRFFADTARGKMTGMPYAEYTLGHEKRG
ncbi:MAG: U32 family peptidase, partial [Lachnospiraceae bacterium]